jgi:hypothetical protein
MKEYEEARRIYLKQKREIKLNEQQKEQLWHKIRQEWVAQGLRGLDIIVKGRLKDIGKGKVKGSKADPNKDPLTKKAKDALDYGMHNKRRNTWGYGKQK